MMRTGSVKSLGNITTNVLKLNGLYNAMPPKKEEEAPEFVHPIMSKADFRESIARYNRHIAEYNQQVEKLNRPVNTYNKAVILNRRNTQISTEQRVREEIWKRRHKDLAPEAYNQKVEEYNKNHGPQFRKRALKQPVKPETERYFVSFLHHYNGQLFQRKANFTKLNVFCPAELPAFKMYPNKISESERDGCKTLPVCKDAIRHHRERMEEAGIILHSKFCGPNRPVKIDFNPRILSMTDNGKQKNPVTENQLVRTEIADKVQYNNVSSRKNRLDKSKLRDKGDAATASSHKNCTEKFYKKTERQGNDQNFTAREKPKKNELSYVLSGTIEEKATLARELSAGKHTDYTPISIKISRQEAYYGAMHPDDFKELAIQDIFKYASSIFIDLEVHPGSWVNAYKIWMSSQKFRTFNGQTFSKPNILERWAKSIAVLKEVRKFKKKHPEWQPRYPNIYFDPAQKYKENNSFQYAYEYFRLDTEPPTNDRERKQRAEEDLRKKTDVRKTREKIRLFFRGKIDLQDVYDYVQNNCHGKIYRSLDELINKEFEKEFNTKI